MRGAPGKSKRARSPSVQEIDTGSHRPFSGVRGRIYSTSEDVLQYRSQPGRSKGFSPIVVHEQGASEQHEDDQQVDWQPISPDAAQHSARLHSSDKRSRYQHTREQQYFHSKLAKLEEKLKGLEEQKAAELKKEKGTRDRELLVELNKDLDRVQAAITALFSSELYVFVATSASNSSLVWCGHMEGHPAGLHYTALGTWLITSAAWLQRILMFKK